MRFEWDTKKAAANLRKHGVSFDEAASVIDDPMLITAIDDEHSDDEVRFVTIGFSNQARLLVVAHTDRAEHIRIISARKATRQEERFYEETD